MDSCAEVKMYPSYLFLAFIEEIVCATIEQLLKWINGSLGTHSWTVYTVAILHLADSVHPDLQYSILRT